MEGGRLRNIILYYLLNSLKELGINMNLLFRRVTETASKDIDFLSKEFFGGKINKENFEQLVKDLSQMLKEQGLAQDIKASFEGDVVNIEVIGCSYLDMASKAKAEGQPGCPVCLISLAASIAARIVSGHTFNITEYESDIGSKVCRLKVTHTA